MAASGCRPPERTIFQRPTSNYIANCAMNSPSSETQDERTRRSLSGGMRSAFARQQTQGAPGQKAATQRPRIFLRQTAQSPRKRRASFRGVQGASGRKAAGDAKAAHIPVTNSTVLEKRRGRLWSRRRLLWLRLLRRFRFPARGSASHAQALKPAIARAARLGARHWAR